MLAVGRVTLMQSSGVGAGLEVPVEVGLGLLLGAGLALAVEPAVAAGTTIAVSDAVELVLPEEDALALAEEEELALVLDEGLALVEDGVAFVVEEVAPAELAALGAEEVEVAGVVEEAEEVGLLEPGVEVTDPDAEVAADDGCAPEGAVLGDCEADAELEPVAAAVDEGLADAWLSGSHSKVVAGVVPRAAAKAATLACAAPCVPTDMRMPPPTSPAATARACTKHMKIVLFCPVLFVRLRSAFGFRDAQKSLVSVPLTHIPCHDSYAWHLPAGWLGFGEDRQRSRDLTDHRRTISIWKTASVGPGRPAGGAGCAYGVGESLMTTAGSTR
jgi:hypothetical protein